MAKDFRKEKLAKFSEERQQAIHAKAQMLIAEEMGLQDLRKAFDYSQKVLSNTLQINQATVSKIERQTDMLISTLRSFIEAMDGELEIIAKFPNHPPIKITQFQDLSENEQLIPQSRVGTIYDDLDRGRPIASAGYSSYAEAGYGGSEAASIVIEDEDNPTFADRDSYAKA